MSRLDLPPNPDADLPEPPAPATGSQAALGGRRVRPIAAALAVVVVVAVGVWALAGALSSDSRPVAVTAQTAPPAVAGTVVTSPASTEASASSTSSASDLTAAAALTVGRRFLRAWNLHGSVERRRAALEPVASVRLTNELSTVSPTEVPHTTGPLSVRSSSAGRVVLVVPVSGGRRAVLLVVPNVDGAQVTGVDEE